jgi:hypothetical protein
MGEKRPAGHRVAGNLHWVGAASEPTGALGPV